MASSFSGIPFRRSSRSMLAITTLPVNLLRHFIISGMKLSLDSARLSLSRSSDDVLGNYEYEGWNNCSS